MKRIVLSTEGVNRYGYRVMTNGINLAAFKKNPVMFFGHATYGMPIGTWTALQIEDGKLTGIPKFDEGDTLALEVKRKYESGVLNAASIGFRVVSSSDDPKLALAGQRYETVTECELLEVSIVSIPANNEATGLSYESDVLNNNRLGFIKTSVKMEKIALQLGLAESASEADILAAINKLQDTEVDAVLSLGKTKGVVNDANVAAFRLAAKSNIAGLRLSFEALPAPTVVVETSTPAPVSSTLAPAGTLAAATLGAIPPVPDANDSSTWDYLQWEKKDPKGLLAMMNSEPSKYSTLVSAY